MIHIIQRWVDRYFADEEAVLVAVMLIAGLAVVLSMGVVLAPMIAALIIAFLMQGLVQRLESWGCGHLLAVSIAFLVLAGSIVVALIYILPAIWRQLLNLFAEAPRMLMEGQSVLLLLPEKYPGLITEAQVKGLIGGLRADLGHVGQSVVSFSLAQLPILVAVLIYVVLVPILVFFFLKDGKEMIAWLTSVLPRERPVMRKIWREMNEQIANYVRGKVVEIFIVAVVTSIAFSFLGLNYALLLGVAVGMSVLIPYIGAAVVTLPVAIIAFFQWGWSTDLMYVMIAYGVIQAIDGNILVPLLFSEAVKMHPVVIVLAVLVFGGLWGFWGVFFAIPLATLCKAIMNAWPTKHKQETAETSPV
ncbi:AI-2E family transporter [Teredinibacter sp. KSP-S5-2]|uniref:AI-2E family transporter n=1 Tax=Teredinibacter sp. KSP-S5-2 TaxID=3034506 RepID=UPI00293411FD|nr:AI-2E family transporter [Teredinibacter sp. KSP-S5-2]WNO09845.1 AI-2E family transporter [Teredinibacter sp. KSP-S5-2]